MRFRSLLALLAIVALTSCRPKPSATIVLDPGLATLVPSDTVFLAGIRMEPLKTTPIYKKYVTEGKIAWVEEFKKNTGLDPRKDLWEFLVVSNGKDSVVMTRGNFSEMGMEPKLDKQGVKRFGYKGYTLLGDDNTAVVFINSSTGIAGQTPYLKRLIDHRDSAGIPKWLASRVKEIPSTNQIWFTGQVAGYLPHLDRRDSGNMANLNNFIDAVDSVTGGIDFRNGVHAHADAACSNDADAKRLHDTLRGVIGMGRLSTPSNRPELLRAYDGIKVDQNGKQVTVDANIPQDLLDQLLNSAMPFGFGIPRAQ